ncbi:MAG: TraR/DksA C4-type zinc finger protein [Pseudomonadota bacterium]
MIDVAKYEKILKERLDELGHRLEDVEHALDEPAPKDFEEAATEREGDEVLESLGQAGEQEIAMIFAALKRVDAGEYGYCVKCGNEILAERLDVVPHAPLCRVCARQLENA